MVGHCDHQDSQPLRSEVLSKVGSYSHPSLRGLESQGGQGGIGLDVGHLYSDVSQTSSCWRAGWTRREFRVWNVDKFFMTRLVMTVGG